MRQRGHLISATNPRIAPRLRSLGSKELRIRGIPGSGSRKETTKGTSFCDRAIGWLGAWLGSALGEQADGFGAVLGVMVERGVEGTELFQRDEREKGSPQKRQILGSFGFAPHAAIFTPTGGITPPMVFVFHRPVLATDPG